MIRKNLLSLLLMFIAFLVALSPAYGGETRDNTYKLDNRGEYSLFTNYVDGFTLRVPHNMEVNMDFSSIYARLENEDIAIDIFKEHTGYNPNSYINYSNGFLKNTWDHKLMSLGYEQLLGNYVHITRWTRPFLERADNDKNYYTVGNIPFDNYCYTLVIKEKEETELYKEILGSFNPGYRATEGKVMKMEGKAVSERNWNRETEKFFVDYFLTEDLLTFGLYEPNTNYKMGGQTYNFSKIKGYESSLDYKFPIIVNYSEFDNTYKHPDLKERLSQAYGEGKVLELTLQTSNSSAGNQVYKILKGEYDEFLRDYGKTISDFNHPVLFRLGNEMNGDWCPYSGYETSRDPEVFRELYLYVYKIFEEQGANENTIWVFNPNSVSFPNFKWNHSYMYYPGNDYVDVVGMTAYNTGTYYSYIGETWKTFKELYNDLYYEYIEAFSQPLMITEFASSSSGGDKPKWIEDMFSNIYSYPGIKVAIWWDGKDYDGGKVARNYTLDENAETFKAFLDFFKPPWHKKSFG